MASYCLCFSDMSAALQGDTLPGCGSCPSLRSAAVPSSGVPGAATIPPPQSTNYCAVYCGPGSININIEQRIAELSTEIKAEIKKKAWVMKKEINKFKPELKEDVINPEEDNINPEEDNINPVEFYPYPEDDEIVIISSER